MALPDLAQAEKTQRNKDWPMLRRLLEANYMRYRQRPNLRQVRFWLVEARTPSLLVKLARRFPAEASRLSSRRPLLAAAKLRDEDAVIRGLADEEQREREADRAYWAPLKRELERLRRLAARQSRTPATSRRQTTGDRGSRPGRKARRFAHD